jgi:hypothetical protein
VVVQVRGKGRGKVRGEIGEKKAGEGSLIEKGSGSIELDGLYFRQDLFFQNKIVSEYVPTKTAADFLGLTENALRIRVCRKQIPALKFGRALRFRVAEIVRLLNPKE